MNDIIFWNSAIFILIGAGKEAVQKEFKTQVDVFVKNKVDFLIAEVTSDNFFYWN